MAISTRRVEYAHEDVALDGLLAVDSQSSVRQPVVLVFHGIEGRSEVQDEIVRSLTEWGYAAFAVDLFGPDGAARGSSLMTEFMSDRARLRDRILHTVGVVRALPEVDANRVAAIGFCFGGLCVLDLARAGADINVLGIASFHGILTPPGDVASTTINAKVMVFHGWDDPYAPPDDVVALGRELTVAGADWQIHAYGNAMHAFMLPTADNPDAGVKYDAATARRAWASLEAFLAETMRDSAAP